MRGLDRPLSSALSFLPILLLLRLEDFNVVLHVLDEQFGAVDGVAEYLDLTRSRAWFQFEEVLGMLIVVGIVKNPASAAFLSPCLAFDVPAKELVRLVEVVRYKVLHVGGHLPRNWGEGREAGWLWLKLDLDVTRCREDLWLDNLVERNDGLR